LEQKRAAAELAINMIGGKASTPGAKPSPSSSLILGARLPSSAAACLLPPPACLPVYRRARACVLGRLLAH
jgi:hypothetical protein